MVLTWGTTGDATTPAVTEYQIEAPTAGPTSGWQVLDRVTDPTVTTYTHDNFIIREPTHYRVAAKNVVGVGRYTQPQQTKAWSYGLHADMNNAGTFNRQDALIIYYVLSFDEVLGNGDPNSGFPSLRQELLANLTLDLNTSQPQEGTNVADQRLRQLMRNVRGSTQEWADTPLDLNQDAFFDENDAILLLHSWDLIAPNTAEVATSSTGEALRRTFLNPFTPAGTEDAGWRQLLLNANRLWDR